MKRTILVVETVYNKQYLDLHTTEDFDIHAIQALVKHIFNARGKNWTVREFDYQHSWIDSTKVLTDPKTLHIVSIAELVLWASDVKFTHEVPVYVETFKNKDTISLILPVKMYIDLDICKYHNHCNKYIFYISFKGLYDDTYVSIYSTNIVKRILNQLIAKGIKKSGDIYYTDGDLPSIYLTGYTLYYNTNAPRLLDGNYWYRFIIKELVKQIDHYNTVED